MTNCTCSTCSPSNFHKCSNCGHLTLCSNQSQSDGYDKICRKGGSYSKSPEVSSRPVFSAIDPDAINSAIHNKKPSERILVSITNSEVEVPPVTRFSRSDQRFKSAIDTKYTKTSRESVNARLKLAQLSADRVAKKQNVPKQELKQELELTEPEAPKQELKPIIVEPVPAVKTIVIDKDLYKTKYRNPPQAPRPLSGKSCENGKNLNEITDSTKEIGLDENQVKLEQEITKKVSDLILNNVTQLASSKPAVAVTTPKLEKCVLSQPELGWKSHIPMKYSKKSQNVFIQFVDVPKDKSVALKIFITPLEYMTELFDYLENITNFYRESAHGLLKVNTNSLKVGDLIIYPFDETYLYRAEVIATGPEILLRLIDFGNTFPLDKSQQILPALKIEKSKMSYAFEVVVSNPEIFEVLEEESEARVKFISEDPLTVILKPKRAEKAESEANENEMNPPKPRFINSGPFLANSILSKDISTGKNIELLVLDVSNLMNHQITVCEFNEQNTAFYDTLDKEVKNYWNENKAATGYLPIIDECVLAELDGYFYRAVCLSISKNKKVNLYFVDYGNIEADIDPQNIMKMPPKMLYTSCAQTCKVLGIEQKISSALDEVLEKIDSQVINAQLVEKMAANNSGRIRYSVTLNFDKLSID